MKLESITVENYRQFEKAELTFDEGITILAGANNSGKTSLINLIKNIFVDDKLNYNMSDIPAKNMREWVEWVYPIFQKFFRDRKTEENVEKDLLNVVIPKEETDSTHLMKMTTVKIHVSYNPDMDDIKLFADCIMDLDETKHDFYFMYNFEIVHTQFAREIINNFSKIKHRFAEIEEKKSQYAETTDELIINNIQVKERYLKQLIVSLYIQATIPNVYFCDEDYKNKCKFDETKKFRQLFNFCFIKASRPLDDDESDHSHMLTNENDDKIKEVVFDICERIFADNPVNSFFETGIFFYRNNPKRIQEWYDDWLSENGKLWQEPLYDRNAILKRFIDAKKIYDLNNDIYMELALTKSSWSVIGYVSHKEYSGDFLLNWYNALVDLDEANIHRFAREIKDVSDKIELLGDNRMRHHIDSKIFSDVFSEGIKDIISFLKNEYYFSQAMKSPYYLVDGLTGYLRKNNPNREQLLLIWTTGMVLLDWRLEDNHSSIAALQKAIEICALRNGYCDIHSDLSLLGPAYINLMRDPVKYIIPDRWVDNTSFSEETTSVEYYEQMIHEYVQDKSYSSTAILEACESLHNKDALKESVVLEIMEHEFFKESSSIERNSLLEYLISFGKAEETDVLIRKYLGMLLQRDHYYCALDVPALVLWKMKQLSPEYGINGMKQILDMHRSWRTAAGHIKDVELTNEIIFTKLVDWNESTDLYTLFLDIALLLIKSEDADVARTALAGVFATLRVEPGYINFIEKMWDSFHYRAKEWILMIYELLWDYREDFHDNMLTILKKHCEDEDFNVSLYSNLLLENYSSDDSFKYIRNSKSYFDEIPNRGHKLFIKKNRPSPWINGYDCVMEQIELLSERLEVDGEHLEKRVADYCDKIPDTVQLIKLGRKWRGCRVVCENPNRSFLRVLYKDWYNHKFDWEETELGRIVLSASEPYCLLITPQLWTYNNGYLLNPPESFISSSSVEQKKQIHDILFEGVDDTETVLAGGIIDYTHKEEIFGFMVSYFSIPGLPSKYAAHCYERNSRLLLQSRPDFSEQEHYNITLHHNGIESFQGSNIMCGFSKISLDEFHWHINITVNGMRLFNEGGQEIGRFEYYYGQRGNMGNRYISNQPLLQRWVVSKDAISKARCIVGCPNNIKINHAFDSVIRKYED